MRLLLEGRHRETLYLTSRRYGTREFEVTTERLGCYQPTEHIDNPLGYAEGDDARRYDRRLRGPVDEERELSIDPRTGTYLVLKKTSRVTDAKSYQD